MYVCMYVCTYVRMYVCTYVRMYVCMYVCFRDVNGQNLLLLFASCFVQVVRLLLLLHLYFVLKLFGLKLPLASQLNVVVLSFWLGSGPQAYPQNPNPKP